MVEIQTPTQTEMGIKSFVQLNVDDFQECGLSLHESTVLHRHLTDVKGAAFHAKDAWSLIVERKLLKPWHPHALHQLIYYSVYRDYDDSVHGPPLYWFPSTNQAKCTNLGRVMEHHGPRLLGASYKDPITSFKEFQKFSVQHQEMYWPIILNELSVQFAVPPKCILDTSDKSKKGGTWLPGALLNIADCCLQSNSYLKKQDDSLAIVWRDEGSDDLSVNRMSLKELRERVMLVANALDLMFDRGDAIAIDMPMTVSAVIIYLAIVLAGFVVVSIADSFAPKEISTRLRVAKAKAIFTQVAAKA